MYRLIKSADELNELLEMETLDETKLEEICRILQAEKRNRYVLADFEFYNEEKLEQIKEEKLNLVKARQFEKAAHQRELEKECQKYVVFKKFFKLEKSLFFPEPDTLIYLFTGKSKNDRAVYTRLTAPGTGVFSKTKNKA
jgi:hypothetical protein